MGLGQVIVTTWGIALTSGNDQEIETGLFRL